MKRFCTTFQAIDKTDGNIKTYSGNDVYSTSHADAEQYVKEFAPYLTVIGEFVEEIELSNIEMN